MRRFYILQSRFSKAVGVERSILWELVFARPFGAAVIVHERLAPFAQPRTDCADAAPKRLMCNCIINDAGSAQLMRSSANCHAHGCLQCSARNIRRCCPCSSPCPLQYMRGFCRNLCLRLAEHAASGHGCQRCHVSRQPGLLLIGSQCRCPGFRDFSKQHGSAHAKRGGNWSRRHERERKRGCYAHATLNRIVSGMGEIPIHNGRKYVPQFGKPGGDE